MFDTHGNDYYMTVNGLSVGLNMPSALISQGKGAQETTHGLPPYRKRRAFLVDEYPACPEDWMRSTGRIKSYFVPIVEGAGLWLDFNRNSSHGNHTATVVSVQGVNAITGLPCKDAQLEQYRHQCPRHKKAFGPDRLCKECGFKWPKQSYIASTGTPEGMLWLDGFRAEDGVIRQYVFTAQVMRGVAKAIIGGDRVFALGISFFLSKEPRPKVVMENLRGMGLIGNSDDVGSKGIACASAPSSNAMCFTSCNNSGDSALYSANVVSHVEAEPDTALYEKHFTGHDKLMSRSVKSFAPSAPMSAVQRSSQVRTKKLEVAAGAKIDQRIYDDPNGLDFWQAEPEGLVVINYCLEEDAKKIIEAGKIDLSGNKEGFLKDAVVGNP